MNPRATAAILIVIAVVIGVVLFIAQGDDEAVIPSPAATPSAAGSAAPEQSEAVVTLTESGFSPQTVTVDAGETVVFQNESGSPAIIASNPHPQHTDLSEFESDTVPDGGTYTFTFEQTGTFGMHNHLNPSHTAEVTVR